MLDNWYETDRVYDGTGAPKIFTNFAIIICHEVSQVFKLPLRQCQGFMDSIFNLKKWDLSCPDYSCLSKRLADLNISSPRYKKYASIDDDVDVVIPPDSDAIYNKGNHPQRNRNLQEIKNFGRMVWQHVRKYGRRNYSELAIFRYKKILGGRLHATELSRQKNEAMLGYGILNKMAGLGMPQSHLCV